ncbi:cupin domain-containing protein [Primorskyibacter sp. S187A]|uniref:cupin domain-containing protein n=1 Tax=Primorskyibacter sp. S187A TaxID=3415130 RepID=UPI003C7E0906
MSARDIIAKLGLAPHPEGGHYRQTWFAGNAGRPTATCIYFLLRAGEKSHWHQVDATEIWLWHAGSPLTLRRAATAQGPASADLLGPDVLGGQSPQLIVEKDHWQAAECRADTPDAYALVSCIVSPGFTFDGFTLAPPGFDIPDA